MKDQDWTKEAWQKLRESNFLDEAALQEVLENMERYMDEELAKNKKTIAKNNKEILATIPYEVFLSITGLA